MFTALPVQDSIPWRRIVPSKRGPIISVPGLDDEWKLWNEGRDAMFERFGLTQYLGCVTAEMRKRPIPQVFQKHETASLTSLYAKHAPMMFSRIIPNLKGGPAAFNKLSKLGAPYNSRPANKAALLKPMFDDIVRTGDPAPYIAPYYTTINVRLQSESNSKVRTYFFVSKQGKTYSQKSDEKALRKVKVAPLSLDMDASRVRPVFNLPPPNLLKQILDTAFHNWLLSHPCFHHNLYSPTGSLPMKRNVFALDVKQFDRNTAAISEIRGAIIGGIYGRIVEEFSKIPFLCVGDDWKSAFFMYVQREAGYMVQFASGDSAVAPIQKEVFLILRYAFAREVLRYDDFRAWNWSLSGGTEDTCLNANYGDDNILSGDKKCVEDLVAFYAAYLPVEQEIPTKFLGMLHTDAGYRLGPDSYILKSWLGERSPGSVFRPFPFYGWWKKRAVYAQYGDPAIVKDVIPFEDALLEKLGMPWTKIMERAMREERLLSRQGLSLDNPDLLLEKDYRLTTEQKLATGDWTGYDADTANGYLKALLDPSWQKKLEL